ncbi:MAG TPA: alpha/beta fold hydrolase [Pyrinomonadaceae bacterium]
MNRDACRLLRLSLTAWLLTFILLSPCAGKDGAVRGTASVNGTRLAYEIRGEGRTVVLIHGGLVDSRMWDDQFDALAHRYRVIRYDLRGFGKSAFPTGPYSHVEDLYALLKFLKVERASLVGLSLGGMIATDLALEHPEMVDRLILTSSALRGYQSPRNEQTIAVGKAAEERGMQSAIELWLEHPFFATGKGNASYQRRMRSMLADNFRYWGPWGPELKSVVVTWPKPATIERLSEIRAPTLIVVGDRDAANILAIADLLAAKIAGAHKVTIKNVSHHLNMEKPREFNKVVLDFLAG